MVAITRGPAKPISAPGSASVMSHTLAKLAVTPPVVGLVSTQIEKPPDSLSVASAAEVLAICISESMPSCMRAPPELVKIKSGSRRVRARSAASETFSPTTSPIEPPMNEKSSTASTTSARPSMRPVPQISASFWPVRFSVFLTFSEYGIWSVKCSRSSARRSAKCSSKLASSSSIATRSRPGSVKWKSQAGQTMPFSSSSLR